MGGRRRIRLGLTALALLATAPAARAQTGLELQVKAAFVTKFPAFVSWPGGALDGDALRICVLGEDGLARALARLSGRAIGDRVVEVRLMPEIERGAACHLLYAAGSARQTPAQALQAVRGQPVLTITDAARGSARGMIHFVVFQDRVRFHIDAAQAAASGISLNSKLLALGLSVRR